MNGICFRQYRRTKKGGHKVLAVFQNGTFDNHLTRGLSVYLNELKQGLFKYINFYTNIFNILYLIFSLHCNKHPYNDCIRRQSFWPGSAMLL